MDALLQIIYILGVIAVVGVYVASIVWAARDAEDRGKSGCLVALLVALLSWPLGLVAWLVFRPERHRSHDASGT
jgi:hypothetical protein